MKIHDMAALSKLEIMPYEKYMVKDATLDGGDVLNTGRHIFVGLSPRTNDNGVNCLKLAFEPKDEEDDYGKTLPVIPIEVYKDLHLKSVVTHVDGYNLIIMDNESGSHIISKIRERCGDGHKYRFFRTKDHAAVNVVRINDKLFVAKGCKDDEAIKRACASAKIDMKNVIEIDNSEEAKADGLITCKCLLITQSK